MNQSHQQPLVVHLTVEDENWLQERQKERENNRPHRRPPAPEVDREKEERGGHEKKAAALLAVVARFKLAVWAERAGSPRK